MTTVRPSLDGTSTGRAGRRLSRGRSACLRWRACVRACLRACLLACLNEAAASPRNPQTLRFLNPAFVIQRERRRVYIRLENRRFLPLIKYARPFRKFIFGRVRWAAGGRAHSAPTMFANCPSHLQTKSLALTWHRQHGQPIGPDV